MVGAFGVSGVVLAGGLARRIGGGDKPLCKIGGHTILSRVIARLEPQCERLFLSANGDPMRFASFGLPVIADGVKQHPGPLAEILAGLDWAAAHRPNTQWILSVPGDCPFLPRDLVARLRQAVSARRRRAGRRRLPRTDPSCDRPVERRDCATRYAKALVVEGLRKVQGVDGRYRVATVDWPAEPLDPFFNVNTVEDLAEAERLRRS